MNKLPPFFAACLLGFCAVASAATYECTDSRGRRSYSATPGPNCRAANLGRMNTYPAADTRAAPAGTNAYNAYGSSTGTSGTSDTNAYNAYGSTATAADARAADARAAAAANERLRQAERNLEEGRKVRYGNERNYARYQERIGKLEEEVNKARQDVNSLNK